MQAGHSQLYPLLQDVDVSVRAASILALGELFGASTLAPSLTESAQNTTNAPPAVNIGQSVPKGFLGKPSTPSLPSMFSSAVGGGTTMLPPGFSRPHPSPSPSLSSSSITVSPFGVSAAALSAHGQSQVQGLRSQSDVLSNTPSSLESSTFGSVSDNNPVPSFSLSDPTFLGCSTTHNVFQRKKVVVLSGEQMELLEAELLLAMQLLKSCTDGSVLVRREAVIAISKFIVFPHHMACMKLVASGLLMETAGAASYDKARASWNSNAASSASQISGKSAHGGHGGVGNDVKEKDLMASNVTGNGTLGSNSARSLSGVGGVSTHHGNNISSKLNETLQSQGKNVPPSDPWHLSLSQTESIVDRLAQYLQCGGYSSTPDVTCNVNSNSTSIFAKLPENNTTVTATATSTSNSVEMRQPVPKLPSQISGNNGINTLIRDTAIDKKLMPPVPPIGESYPFLFR